MSNQSWHFYDLIKGCSEACQQISTRVEVISNQVTPSHIEAGTNPIRPVRQLHKVVCWKDFAAGFLSFGLMQGLICVIATTLIQHKYLPFEVTVDNELPPLSLGCVRWRQLEMLPTKFVAVKVDFFVYENSNLPKNQWSLLTFLQWHSRTVRFIMSDRSIACPRFLQHVNLTESITKVSLWSHMKRRRMWQKLD